MQNGRRSASEGTQGREECGPDALALAPTAPGNRDRRVGVVLVPGAGVEPACPFGPGILSPLRIPIPPPRRCRDTITSAEWRQHARIPEEFGREKYSTIWRLSRSGLLG